VGVLGVVLRPEDFLVVAAIVVFVAAMLGLIWCLERI